MNVNIDAVKSAADLLSLPYIDDTMRYSSTSYDREGYNQDYNQSLYIDENGQQVLLDVKGKGCVYKIFLPTVFYPEDNLSVYIDDCSVPAIDGSIQDIFSGRHPRIPEELVEINVPAEGNAVRQSGYIMYLPIPFSKRIKITSAGNGKFFYYHIDYALYPQEAEVESYGACQDCSALISAMRDGCIVGGKKYGGVFESEMNKANRFFSIQQENMQITCLRLKLDKIYAHGGAAEDYQKLNDLQLKIFFDGKDEPFVNAPFSSLFGFPTHGPDPNAPDYRTKSLAFGIDEGNWLYLKYPMPFCERAEVQMENMSGTNISVEYEIFMQPFSGEQKWGYFHAKQLQTEINADDKNDIRMIELEGSGRLVGIVASMDTDVSAEKGQYLEGDEHIYIDGSRSPQVNGTGTEDFYNGAYYWNSGTLSRPFYGCGYNAKWAHGSVRCAEEGTYKTMAYRVLIGDSVPFRSRLIFDMEHGPVNDCYEKIDGVLFYYFNQEPSLHQTDELMVADEKSSEEHCYQTKLSMPLKCCSAFEGLCDGEEYTYRGRMLGNRSSSEFEAALSENADYVILRRVLDYSYLNQCAEIYVDDIFCGVWYDAGANCAMRLRESEFRLPVHATKNKKKIKVKVCPLSAQWSECRYQVFCGK